MSRGVIKVGINTDSKPFVIVNKDGCIQGYDADLARYISQYLLSSQYKVELIPVTPSNRIMKVSTGEVDMVISTMTITPQREEILDFSIPYDVAGQALLVKSTSKITSIADLGGQNVGVVWGTTAEKNMLNLAPNANIIGFKTYNEAYKALKAGYINAITSDDTILSRFALEDKEVKLEDYYVRMMIAWYLATGLAKNYDSFIKAIEEHRFDAFTHNKAVQKAVESYRVSEEHKAYLKTLKIK